MVPGEGRTIVPLTVQKFSSTLDMPPQKRVRPTDDDPPPDAAPEPVPKAVGVVFELPNEIWLEVLSYFCSVRVPTLKVPHAPLLSSSTLERAHALRALSQTCRARAVFLPQLWERLEVNPCASFANATPIPRVNRLLSLWSMVQIHRPSSRKRSRGLAHSPDHAKHVRTVSVALTRCKAPTALAAFAQCLKALPRLHTLQILRAHTQMTAHLKRALAFAPLALALPQVHTVVLPTHTHNVLRACPAARAVMCNCGDGGKLVGAIANACREVRVLRGFEPDVNMMKRFVKGVPNLDEISLNCADDATIISMLSPLAHRALHRVQPSRAAPGIHTQQHGEMAERSKAPD
ncbi:hypothetical protein C0993_000445 [Termitomyces sp. T159_Od127]|nr:hypothetical protein C0993_000445 [Termitomyces sp. T159_Od127]